MKYSLMTALLLSVGVAHAIPANELAIIKNPLPSPVIVHQPVTPYQVLQHPAPAWTVAPQLPQPVHVPVHTEIVPKPPVKLFTPPVPVKK